MLVLSTEEEMTGRADCWRGAGERIALVPTMGNLHEGHLSLVRIAASEADRVVVSIFVNPTQFGEGEDLDSYPRTPEEDLSALRELDVDAVFLPGPNAVYSGGFSTWVEVEGLTEALCGAYRPGHFRGVTTVCAVLFGIVRPHVAVFGRKDAQQLAVIRRMAADLRMGVEVVAGPVVREADGLARSSRNGYLSPDERRQAAAIYRGLSEARRLAFEGETDPRRLLAVVRKSVEPESRLRLQYVELVDPDTMESLAVLDRPGLLATAVFAGDTRLIDNVILKPDGNRNCGR